MSESGNNSAQSAILRLEIELFLCCCNSDLLSEEGLREVLTRHGLKNHQYVSDEYYFRHRMERSVHEPYQFFFAACVNERATEGIIQCLLEYFPGAASATNDCGQMPLHWACGNSELEEATALKIMKLLIEKYPEAVRHANDQGRLPIHMAAFWKKSPEFCRVLIESYPGSERITDDDDALPLHHACSKGSLATVEYLYRIFGDGILHACSEGLYPIHYAICNPAAGVEIVQFLLDCDPNQKQFRGKPLFRFVCCLEHDESNIEARIEIMKILFDARPEVIEDNRIASNIRLFHQHVQSFVNGELVYARQAKDHRLMNTPDEHGQLPLHRALQNDVRLGSIKLLVKGNPSAIRNIDDIGAFPLHVACEHNDSTSVVEYILGLSPRITRDAIDSRGNTTLHYACRGAKYDTIALLLEKYGAASVSKRNAHCKLPIDMLWESNEVSDRESVEYTGSVFQLLRAYPEIVMNYDTTAIRIESGYGKKRKYGNAELAAINEAAQGGRAVYGESRSSKRRRKWWWWW